MSQPHVNRDDPEDCDACSEDDSGECLYHEGWAAGASAIGQLIAAVTLDPEMAWDAYMRGPASVVKE